MKRKNMPHGDTVVNNIIEAFGAPLPFIRTWKGVAWCRSLRIKQVLAEQELNRHRYSELSDDRIRFLLSIPGLSAYLISFFDPWDFVLSGMDPRENSFDDRGVILPSSFMKEVVVRRAINKVTIKLNNESFDYPDIRRRVYDLVRARFDGRFTPSSECTFRCKYVTQVADALAPALFPSVFSGFGPTRITEYAMFRLRGGRRRWVKQQYTLSQTTTKYSLGVFLLHVDDIFPAWMDAISIDREWWIALGTPSQEDSYADYWLNASEWDDDRVKIVRSMKRQVELFNEFTEEHDLTDDDMFPLEI